MKTRSNGSSPIGVPASKSMYSSDRAANPTIEETSTFVGLHAAAGGVTIDALVME